jgi:MATE family multidrug resistance protein
MSHPVAPPGADENTGERADADYSRPVSNATLPETTGLAPASERPDALAHLGDERRTGRMVLRIAWPAIVENALHTLLGLVDTILVARLGTEAVAGVGAGTQWVFLFFSNLFGLSTGVVVLVARAIGAGDRAAASRAARQGLVLGGALGLAFTFLCLLFAESALRVLGAEPEVVAIGTSFLRIASYGGVLMGIGIVGGAALRATGDTRTPMLSTALANVVNAGLAYWLIFGGLGLPALGADGSAWGLVAARLVAAVWLIGALARGPLGLTLGGLRPDGALLRRIGRIGLPSVLEQVLLMTSFMAYAWLAIGLGTAVFAAQRITINAVLISVLPAFGFAIAATTLTGQALGAGRPDLAERTAWVAVRLAALWMSAMGLAFFLLGEPLLRLFTDDPAVLEVGVPSLRVIGAASPLWSVGLVLLGALRGAGDTRFPMLVTLVTGWLIRVPFGFLFGITLGLGLPGVYVGTFADAVVGSLMAVWRYRRGAWRSVRL